MKQGSVGFPGLAYYCYYARNEVRLAEEGGGGLCWARGGLKGEGRSYKVAWRRRGGVWMMDGVGGEDGWIIRDGRC